MRCMMRNKTKFYYALFSKRIPITDEYGNSTGEFDIQHGDPTECWANISPAKGETQVQQFGESVPYDKVIVMDATSPSLDEYSVLWIDTIPELNDDGSLATNDDGDVKTPHDYIVRKVAKSLNSVSYAVSKVNVT